jgi:hypothetical protein
MPCCSTAASVQVAFIDKAWLASASRPGARVDVFRQASVLLASERSRRLAAAAGLHATTEAYRCTAAKLSVVGRMLAGCRTCLARACMTQLRAQAF